MTTNAPRNAWGSAAPEGAIRRLDLPSGNQCDAVRTGMQGLVLAGVLSEGDSLTDLVDRKHIRRVRGGKGPDREEINSSTLMEDPEQFGKIIMTVDRLMPHVIQVPEVRLHFTTQGDKSTLRIPEEDREPGVVYTDQVPLADKMFLFNWAVGGSADADRFLRESRDAVAAVDDGEGVPRPAKRASRGKKKHDRV